MTINTPIRLSLSMMVMVAGFCARAEAQTPYLPSVKILQGTAITPANADTYYGAGTTHTVGVSGYTRPAEITELGKGLGADLVIGAQLTGDAYALRVFQYIYSNIDNSFLFGLQKGAYGALIDQSGTTFDQAHLMVELLKVANITTATYQYGTITLSATQLTDWTGLTNAAAVCDLFASGGTPESGACSGALGSFQISHVWISYNGNLYDPSYKKYTFKSAIDVAAAMRNSANGGDSSCTTDIATAAVAALTSGANTANLTGSTPAIQSMNATAVNTKMSCWAMNLKKQLDASYPNAETADIIGGRSIDLSVTPTPAAALPYSSVVVTRTFSDIPDQYRTTLRVQVNAIDKTMFVDEIANKRLRLVAAPCVGSCSPPPMMLVLDQQTMASSSTGPLANAAVALTANHPYAATSGAYMDETVQKIGSYGVTWNWGAGGGVLAPTAIVHGWGATSSAQVGKIQQLNDRDSFISDATDANVIASLSGSIPLMTGARPQIPVAAGGTMAYDPRFSMPSQNLYGVNWLVSVSRMSEMVGNVNAGRVLHHHSLGLVTSNAGPLDPESAILDIESGISVVSATNAASARRSMAYSFAALASRLEGSLAEQGSAWDGMSTTSLISRFNETLEDGPRRYTRMTSTAEFNAAITASALQDYQYTAPPVLARADDFFRAYLDNGYTVYIPAAFQYKYAAVNGSFEPDPPPSYMSLPRGSIVVHPSSGDSTVPDRIGFIVNLGQKGALATNPVLGALADAGKRADYSAKARGYYGADLNSGRLTLSPAADLSTGAGDFPRGLSFQRRYDSAQSSLGYGIGAPLSGPTAYSGLHFNQYDGVSTSSGGEFSYAKRIDVGGQQAMMAMPVIGSGWTNNWEISAKYGMDVAQGFGEDSPIDAVGSIAALYAIKALTASDPSFQQMYALTFVTNWFGLNLQDNVVTVSLGGSGETFTKLPDGSFNGGPRSQRMLEQTGSRILDPYVIGYRAWTYSQVSYKLTDGDGSSLTFGTPNGNPTIPSHQPVLWQFPDGTAINFTYTLLESSAAPGFEKWCLQNVSNNLGRTLSFSYSIVAGYCRLTAVSDENGRSVNFARPSDPSDSTIYEFGIASVPELRVTGPDGGVTKYLYTNNITQFGTPRVTSVLASWYTPGDGSNAFMGASYDSLFRLKTLTDAKGAVSNFYIGSMSVESQRRGESIDPLGAVNTTYFGKWGEALQSIDALNRTTTNIYDLRGRLIRTTYPVGNATQYNYDSRHNKTSTAQVATPGSAGNIPVSSATFKASCSPTTDPTCNLPLTTADGLGNTTTYGYKPATGQLTRVVGPAVSGGSAQTDNCYSTIGPFSLLTGQIRKVGASENRVSSFSYNSGNKYVLQSVTVDPATTLVAPGPADSGACTTTSKGGALDLTSSVAYDNKGNLTSVDGPVSGSTDTTTYQYDLQRRLTSVSAPLSAFTRYCYDADGLTLGTHRARVATSDPNSTTATTTGACPNAFSAGNWQSDIRAYYRTGDLLSVTDAESNTTTYAYDAVGRTRVVQDPAGRQSATVYDLGGQTVAQWRGGTGWLTGSGVGTAVSGSAPVASTAWVPGNYVSGPLRYMYSPSSAYNGNGKPLWVQDANDNRTEYQYDDHDRLWITYFPQPGSGDLCSHQAGNNTGSTTSPAPSCSGSPAPTYEKRWYTSTGLLWDPPCSGAFDAVCRLRTRNNETIAYTYDALNRVATRTPTGQGVVTTAYNLLNEPTSISEPASGSYGAHTTAYTYDSAGRKLTETNDSRQVSYQYDAAGNRLRTTWPDAYFVTYEYDLLNRMKYVRENSSSANELAYYEYDGLSRRTLFCSGGQSGSCSSGGGTNKATYTYEPDSNLDALTQVLNATAVTLDYGHNAAGQITSIAANDDFYLTKPTGALATTTYTPNKLNQYGTINAGTALSPTYDANGNTLTWYPLNTSGSKHTYTWDSENRLVTAAINGSGTASISYDYDALGRRQKKTVSGTVTQYLLDGDEEIAELDNSGAVLRRYITGPAVDDRIARAEGSATSNPTKYYYHTNHQGSVVAMTDASGSTACSGCGRIAYDEYGNTTTTGSPLASEPFGYTGRRFDPETGIYFYRARYYTPQWGRFLSTDPIGYKDDYNLYAYTGNDPANHTDPTGAIIDTVLDVGFLLYDIYAFAKDPSGTNAAAFGADLAGVLIPGVTGLGAGVRAAERGADVARGIDKTADAAKAVHGNSAASMKPQHRYEIVETKTGQVKKTGISGQELNANGSPRANQQVNKLNKEAGENRYEAIIKEKNIPGRSAALERERAATAELVQKGEKLEFQCRPDPSKFNGCK